MLRRTSQSLLRLQILRSRQINICVIPVRCSMAVEYRNFSCGLERNKNLIYNYSTSSNAKSLEFEKACVETLESLNDYFEELVENSEHLKSADVSYSDGVLTINFGEPYGSYVINRQSPNQQIWLSSPTSGPKRYDFIADGSGYWLYKHDGMSMHELLQKEIELIVKSKVDFMNLAHGSR